MEFQRTQLFQQQIVADVKYHTQGKLAWSPGYFLGVGRTGSHHWLRPWKLQTLEEKVFTVNSTVCTNHAEKVVPLLQGPQACKTLP